MKFLTAISSIILALQSPRACTSGSIRGSVVTTDERQLTALWVDPNNPPLIPLLVCQGDCDNDSDCAGDLICFQREAGDPVPGCTGSDSSVSDYCIVDPGSSTVAQTSSTMNSPTSAPVSTSLPALHIVPENPPPSPLGLCQGDCDNDSQCAGNLICFQREGGDSVPGCAGTDGSVTDYCIEPLSPASPPMPPPTPSPVPAPTPSPVSAPTAVDLPLVFKGLNPDNTNSSNRLQLCEGDCDSDYDCAQGLMCWQRTGFGNIPGCQSNQYWDSDFCVDEIHRGTDGDRFYFPYSPVFRLKLYWEQGYYWQEETFERRWCIECIHGSCYPGEQIFMSECSIARNDLLEFVDVGGGYFQIKEAAGNVCYQRFADNTISWQWCDSMQIDQHFWAADLQGKTLDTMLADKFELRPRREIPGHGLKCVTQRHHPKDNEWMALEDCVSVRADSDTSLWNKY